jgi:hypothetical protein
VPLADVQDVKAMLAHAGQHTLQLNEPSVRVGEFPGEHGRKSGAEQK